MRKWGVFLLLLILSSFSYGQVEYKWRIQNTPGGVSGTGNSGFFNVSAAGATFSALSWTFSGAAASCSIQVDFSNDGSTVAGQTIAAQNCLVNGSTIAVGSSTPPYVRVAYTIAAGGTVTFVAKGCINSTCTVGGGGTGTVTNTGGALTSNSPVLGAGGNDTKVSTGITSNGVAELDLGVVGTSGVLGLKGSTSGTATFTAPAVAGTVTNRVISSNSISVPDGTTALPAYGFTNQGSQGLTNASGNLGVLSTGAINIFVGVGPVQKFQMNGAGNFLFTSGKGQHFQTQAANNDYTGVCTSASGTTCAITFTTNYTSTPSCIITPTTAGITSAIITTQANSGFTVTYAPSGAATFNYMCAGNPN